MRKPSFIGIAILLSLLPAAGQAQPAWEEIHNRLSAFQEQVTALDGIAILHGNILLDRNPDVEYPFRQESNLYYLTGWTGRDATLIVHAPGEKDRGLILYVPPRDPRREVWTGPMEGLEEARDRFPGLDVQPRDSLWEDLPSLLYGMDRLLLSAGNDIRFQKQLDLLLEDTRGTPTIRQEAADILGEQRLLKSPYEIQQIEQAITVTGRSLENAFARIPSLEQEYELAAWIEFGFQSRGAERLAFPSIVAAGTNATFLHYDRNNNPLEKHGLVLMDVGAEWGYYSADISRTVPVDGTFNNAQRRLYEMVLQAQTEAIAMVEPGAAFRVPHTTAVRRITQGLIDLGILEGDVDTLVAKKAYRPYFMHGTSHWLGLDVHDVGGYRDADGALRSLEPGMILTVEPGIYLKADDESVPKKYRGIGIRIEDDVLVTPEGHRVLSRDIPRQVDEIEALMEGAKGLFRRGL